MATNNAPESTQTDEEIEFESLDNLEEQNPMRSRSGYSGEEESEPDNSVEESKKVPEKFKGKSSDEIMEMYRNLEQEFSRKNNELGELRGKVDTLLDLKRTEQQTPGGQSSQGETSNRKEVTEDEFWENPKEAVRKMLESSEYSQKLNQIESHLTEQNRAQGLQQFKKKHPDYMEVVKDQDFQQWVTATPKRVELFQQADQHDYDAADELLSLWKSINGNNSGNKGESNNTELREMSDRESLKEAQVERSGNGGQKKTKGKYFRRADIIDLQVNNPDRYKALLPEIMQAYAEGRVK